MASESPYIGSKISLISKAKIRYEGVLYTIDTDNATVALSKVRSFGTEDRQCERVVHPRDEVYEYIIFRGTDIEDLTVCEPPKSQPPAPSLPQDPAIVQSVVTSQQSGPPPLPPFSGNVPYSQVPSAYNSYMPPRMPYQPMAPGQPLSHTESKVAQPMHQQSHSQQIVTGKADKPASPLSPGRSSPTSEQGVQTANPASSQERSTQRRMYESNNYYNSRHNAEHRSYHGQRGGYRHHDGHDYNRNKDWENDMRNRHNDYANRGHRNYQSQNYRGHRPRGNRRFNPRNDPLRFDGDFDFEQSNAQFNKEDIAKELMSKLKITSTSVKDEVKPKVDEKQDSGVDSGQSNETAEESDEGDDLCYYDKTKSFFDNITCETTNPRGERMSWSEERKRNTETFGAQPYRGRGRGGYRGRGYRGRGRGQYRGRGGYRSNNHRDDGYRYNNHDFHRGYNQNYNGGGNRGYWGRRDNRPNHRQQQVDSRSSNDKQQD